MLSERRTLVLRSTEKVRLVHALGRRRGVSFSDIQRAGFAGLAS